jgi:diguanylate cyclase (GGDEF)-like protein/PAS domain S-box-containing protein
MAADRITGSFAAFAKRSLGALLMSARRATGAFLRSRPAATGRPIRPLLMIGAACAVALLAGTIVARLDAAERFSSSRELELKKVEVLVESLTVKRWEALAEGKVTQATLDGFHKSWSETNRALAQLRAEGPGDPRLSGILLAFDAYVADLDQELALLQAGDQIDAERFERESLAPVLDLLSSALAGAESAYHIDAQKAASDKVAGSLVTLIIAACLLVGLLWLARESQVRAERRFRSLVQHSNDIYSIVSLDGLILYESPAVERTLGYAVADRVGTQAMAVIHPDDQPLAEEILGQLQTPGAEREIDLRIRHADGTWRQISAFAMNLTQDPAVGGIAVTYRDVTDQRQLEEQLRRQALEDPLTGLANRALLRDRLDHAVTRSQRRNDGTSVAVFFMDLDDFKGVNDTLGHAAGDAVLAAVGERIKGAVRAIDTVARVGGDEFAVLAEEIPKGEDPSDLGRRVIDALGPAFDVAGTQIFVRASIGYAVGGPTDDGEILMRNADLAMYQAKVDGTRGLRRYDSALHDTAVSRMELTRDLRRALEDQEFFVAYQPIVSLESDRIVGLEALVRWNHPTRGTLPPDDFISAAEDSGQIIEIGRWVLREACRQLAAWTDSKVASPDLTVSVNLSVRQIQDAAIADDIAAALRDSGLEGRRLTLEITENILVEDSEAVIGRLTAIRALGVRIAIDDFGTGFSSLAYLSRLPIDVLKIDRSFIERMAGGSNDVAVIEAAIGLAERLGLATVAEGIERSAQTDRLLELGCELGQGFLYARPATADQTATLLAGPGAGSAASTKRRRAPRPARSSSPARRPKPSPTSG